MTETSSSFSKLDQLKSIIPYLAKYKPKLFLGFLFILLTNLVAVIQPIFIKKAVDSLETVTSEKALAVYALSLLGIAFFEGIFLYFMRQTIIVVSRYVEYDLRNDYFAHLQKMSIQFFHNHPTGDLMARATNDLNAVRALVGPGIMYFVNTTVRLIGTLIVMLSINSVLTFFALLTFPIMVFAVAILMRRIHDSFKRSQELYAEITTHAQENISGIRIVKVYIQEELEKQRFEKLNKKYVAERLSLAKIRALLWACMGFLSGLGVLIVLWVGGHLVANGTISIGSLTAFFTLLTHLTWPMIALGWVINLTQQGIASMARINEILHIEPEIEANPNGKMIDSLRGEIEFRNVSFSYNSVPVLKNISLKIKSGTTLAIVGRTGSGKSTLANLIPRLLQPSSGEILIDGLPIETLSLAELRRNIGHVPQETFLFSESIAENIAFGIGDAKPEDVEKAGKLSQVHKDILGFPQKYETVLGERGINISGGQKQRTAISRAIIRNPAILILDDALSAVDTYTEEEILKRLRRELTKRTNVIISHRISTIRDADNIIVLENGEIAEQGDHNSLLENDGLYANLYQMQLLEESLEEL
ncbi:MAG: ABC transporter ATP-binding protein [Calditrichaeota bacterium]|nr:MAG: ABC transporter ATP-binding protein [Calditrichota bacterium]